MADRTLHAELDEQRCLIEQQQIEIRRLKRKIELQARSMTELQDRLDSIQSALPHIPPTSSKVSTSNKRRNGNGHAATLRRGRETTSHSDQP